MYVCPVHIFISNLDEDINVPADLRDTQLPASLPADPPASQLKGRWRDADLPASLPASLPADLPASQLKGTVDNVVAQAADARDADLPASLPGSLPADLPDSQLKGTVDNVMAPASDAQHGMSPAALLALIHIYIVCMIPQTVLALRGPFLCSTYEVWPRRSFSSFFVAWKNSGPHLKTALLAKKRLCSSHSIRINCLGSTRWHHILIQRLKRKRMRSSLKCKAKSRSWLRW